MKKTNKDEPAPSTTTASPGMVESSEVDNNNSKDNTNNNAKDNISNNGTLRNKQVGTLRKIFARKSSDVYVLIVIIIYI